jgi:hypothetical protein
MIKMAVSKETKTPLKFHDCFTGDEIDDICKDSNNNNHGNDQLETPMPRHQINGKTNNVTFIILPDRIELWKNAVLHYFGVKKTTLLKDGTVVKIICDCGNDKNCSIKINFYKTGSVVIQGAKCVQLCDLYFLPLKDKVHETAVKSDLNISVQGDTNDSDLNLDRTKVQGDTNHSDLNLDNTKVELKLEENNLLDNSVTFAKTLIHDNNTSTPIRNNTTEQANEHVESPKERITKQSNSKH